MNGQLVVLNEKNPTIGPMEASTARFTASEAIRSCKTTLTFSREPIKALKTYSEGKVTPRVRKNSAGTFNVVAHHCMYEGSSGRQPA